MNGKYRHGRLYVNHIAKWAHKVEVELKRDAFCGRFWCWIVDEAACCMSCPLYLRCDFACLNSPDKCGLCIGPDEEE